MKLTLNITNKNLLKKILAISLPVFVVGASITTYIVKTNKDKSNLVNNVVSFQNGVKRQVYVVCEDDILFPVTVTVEKKELITDEINELVNLIKEDSSLVKKDFKPLLTEDCELKNVSLEEDTVTLNFSKEFVNYDKNLENRLVESLVWTCLQYDEVNNVKIQVEDEDLVYMPLNNFPLATSLNKSIGINNHLTLGNSIEKSVNVFFEKKINDKNYYVPVSVKVQDLENDYEEIIMAMNEKLPLSSSLNTPNEVSKIEVLKYNELDENNNLNLTLSSKSLYDEKTIDSSVFNYLVMNLVNNDNDIKTISITVNDELMSVNGYEENVIEVGSLTYNEIKI